MVVMRFMRETSCATAAVIVALGVGVTAVVAPATGSGSSSSSTRAEMARPWTLKVWLLVLLLEITQLIFPWGDKNIGWFFLPSLTEARRRGKAG